MDTLKKLVVALVVTLALATTAPALYAGCGECKNDKEHKHDHDHHDHDHEKEACRACEHAKSCEAFDCDDPAHEAECICQDEDE